MLVPASFWAVPPASGAASFFLKTETVRVKPQLSTERQKKLRLRRQPHRSPVLNRRITGVHDFRQFKGADPQVIHCQVHGGRDLQRQDAIFMYRHRLPSTHRKKRFHQLRRLA